MTTHTPPRRPYARRTRHVTVAGHQRDDNSERLARILTSAALSKAAEEAAAQADYAGRLATSTQAWGAAPSTATGEAHDA